LKIGVSVRHIFKPISYLEIQLLSGVSGGYIISSIFIVLGAYVNFRIGLSSVATKSYMAKIIFSVEALDLIAENITYKRNHLFCIPAINNDIKHIITKQLSHFF
ncbi:hypothetical protein, partial [Citrobacter amalonaticus]|uniref:hypothetical protein n=1 Tax=Citrobacter amalonaticus TaxID=35703 RepID=UPI0019812742